MIKRLTTAIFDDATYSIGATNSRGRRPRCRREDDRAFLWAVRLRTLLRQVA